MKEAIYYNSEINTIMLVYIDNSLLSPDRVAYTYGYCTFNNTKANVTEDIIMGNYQLIGYI